MHWNSERQRQMGRQKDWSPLKDSEEVSSVCQSCLILCNTMYCTTPGLPVHLQLTESTQPMSIELWCHLTISSSVIPFASCPQYFPASESLPMSQLFASGGQNIGVSVSTSVFPMNIQDISIRINWLDLLAVQGTLKSLLQHHGSKASILWHSASL